MCRSARLPHRATRMRRRETEVLRLVAAGCRDRTIAAEAGIGRRTVTPHVTRILAKLDFDNRTAAATLAVRRGLA